MFDLYRQLIDTYSRIGVPADVIGQWAISGPDAELLVAHLSRLRPRRILEVGTYVGVSTLLMASTLPRARIVTIDPNFQLHVEATAMNVPAGNIGSLRTLDIARRVAASMSLADRIRFVEGGFSTDRTFATYRPGFASNVAIVGPKLLAEEKEFDLVFIDGLHQADAVHSDIRLVATRLTRNGVILLHDCVGAWGTNVRTGVLRFLRERPDFQFVHPTYGTLYTSIGMLASRDNKHWSAGAFRSSDAPTPMVRVACERFVGDIVDLFSPLQIIEVAASGLKPLFEARGIQTTICGKNNLKMELGRRPLQDVVHRTVVVSHTMADFAPEEDLRQVFLDVADTGSGLCLLVTPPGETGVAGPFSRPLGAIAALAEAAGLTVAVLSRRSLDPFDFAFTTASVGRPVDSFGCLFVCVGTQSWMARHIAGAVHVNPENAEQPEQESLLRVHYGCAMARLFSDVNATEQARAEAAMLSQRLSCAADQLRMQVAGFEDELRARLASEAALRATITAHHTRGEDLEKQVLAAQKRNEDLVIAYDASQAANEEVRAYAGRLEGELRKRDEVEAALRATITAHHTRGEDLEKQVLAAQKRNEDLVIAYDASQAANEEVRAYAGRLEGELRKRDEVEAALRATITAHHTRGEDLEKQVLAAQKRNEDLVIAYDASQAANEEVRAYAGRLEGELRKRDEVEAALRATITAHHTRGEDLEKQVLAAQKRNEDLVIAYDASQAANEEVRAYAGRLEGELRKRDEVEAALRATITAHHTRGEDLEKQVLAAQKRNEDLVIAYDASQAANEEVRAYAGRLEGELRKRDQ